MSSDLLPANSGLLGIAIVIRAKDGPRFVFHYPPRLANPDRELPRWGTELDPTTPEASDDEEANEDDDVDDPELGVYRNAEELKTHRRRHHHVSQWNGDEHFMSEDGIHIVPWEHLDAFSTKDLASILTPSRAYHKKCFELSLDPVYYISYPMHVREDGQWKKVKKSKKKKNNRDHDRDGDGEAADAGSAVGMPVSTTDNTNHKKAMGEEVNGTKAIISSSFVSDEGSELAGMTMFNLVFMMHPSRFEARRRINDMYEYVAKDLNRALRFAQHYNNYVWKECEIIHGLKDKAREESEYVNTGTSFKINHHQELQ